MEENPERNLANYTYPKSLRNCLLRVLTTLLGATSCYSVRHHYVLRGGAIVSAHSKLRMIYIFPSLGALGLQDGSPCDMSRVYAWEIIRER